MRRVPHEEPLSRVVVWPDPSAGEEAVHWAEDLARRMRLPVMLGPAGLERFEGTGQPGQPGDSARGEPDIEAALVVGEDRLSLRLLPPAGALSQGRALRADLEQIDVSSKAGGRPLQPIAKAVGLPKRRANPPWVLDATAGWGEDAWVVAALGCRVLAVERHPLIAALVQDGLRRARQTHPRIAGRIQLIQADSLELLRDLAHRGPEALLVWAPPSEGPPTDRVGKLQAPDVIYLDPMFTAARKTAERRPMRVLRALVGADPDAEELLSWALAAARRVVVKRPLKAEPLAGRAPQSSHRGKSLRYDVYRGAEA